MAEAFPATMGFGDDQALLSGDMPIPASPLPSWLFGMPETPREPSPSTLWGLRGNTPSALGAGDYHPGSDFDIGYGAGVGENAPASDPGDTKPASHEIMPFGQPPVDFSSIEALGKTVSAQQSGLLDDYIKGQTAADRELFDLRTRQSDAMRKAVEAESYTLGSMPPQWNADAERQARMTGPFESFGSIGSIFGIMASIFTKMPIASALNASAAAMNAIHQRDDEGYKSAYQAWKDNTELALKRFDMEKQIAEETNKLFDIDVNKWVEKKAGDAARFGDRWKQVYIENGLWGELLDAEQKAFGVRDMMRQPVDSVNRWHQNFGVYQELSKGLDVSDQYLLQYALAKDDKPTIEYLNRVSQYYSNHEGMKMPEDERRKQWAETHAPSSATRFELVSPGGATTAAGFRVQLAKEKIDAENAKRQAEGKPPLTPDEKIKIEGESRRTPLSESARGKIEEKIDAYSESMNKIDASVNKLNRYIGVAGAAGYATRLTERIGNILGRNATDRQQFQRDIEYIRAQAKRLLLDESASRALKEDAQRIDTIVGGISMGDTGKSALRSLQDIRAIYERLQRNEKARLEGTWTPETDTAPVSPKTSTRPWQQAPLVNP